MQTSENVHVERRKHLCTALLQKLLAHRSHVYYGSPPLKHSLHNKKKKEKPFALPNIAAHKLQNFPTSPLQVFPSQCGSVSGCLAKNPVLQAPPFSCLIHPIRLLLPPRNIWITNKPICVFSSFSCHFINSPLCIWMRERPRRRVCASSD